MCDLSNLVPYIPFSGIIVAGIIVYAFLEFILHCIAACKSKIDKTTSKFTFSWGIILAILSIGYAFASYYKGEKGEKLKDFIERCNLYNLILSFILMVCSFIIISNVNDLAIILLIQVINGYRFISRSFEIVIAFGGDVLKEEQNRSGLVKSQRIELAVKSYFEIYLYSASFYATIINNDSDTPLILKSLLMSLSVGTLTNVAYSQENLSDWLQLLPFVQVLATLSLVVLSLTMYVSRNSSYYQITYHK